MADYKYPRVTISTTAKVRSRGSASVEDTTVLFVPLITKKGPTTVTPVHSLSEFINIFGDLDYEHSGQTALNVYNWLAAGGTIYVKRLVNEAEGKALFATSTHIGAKYFGDYYNDLNVVISGSTITVQRKVNATKIEVLEKIYKVTDSTVESCIAGSEYIEILDGFNPKDFVDLGYNLVETTANGETTTVRSGAKETTLQIITKSTPAYTSLDDTVTIQVTSGGTTQNATVYLLENYWNNLAAKDLGNPLETPIDLIIDAGYPQAIKVAMANFICNGSVKGAKTNPVRPDIFGIFDAMCYKTETTTGGFLKFTNNKLKPLEEVEAPVGIEDFTGTNIGIYDQYFTVEDATFTDQNIFVGPTYFLSRLLPYNDINYGLQWATAGLRRGVLVDALAVNENPDADKKNTNFLNRINYVEKSTREYAFMSQRTHDGSTDEEYTSLSFINNARVLEKMKKQLERLGREYLFEFNDSVTLSQLASVLNKYVTEWISNRTLSYGLVEVSRNPYNDEAVDIRLNIKFNRTIELISVDITID